MHKASKASESRDRKKENQPRPARYTNWHAPFLWSQIKQAAIETRLGTRMSAVDIVRHLKHKDTEIFAHLRPSTVDGWIDKSGPRHEWKTSVLLQAERGHDLGHSKGGRRGILV